MVVVILVVWVMVMVVVMVAVMVMVVVVDSWTSGQSCVPLLLLLLLSNRSLTSSGSGSRCGRRGDNGHKEPCAGGTALVSTAPRSDAATTTTQVICIESENSDDDLFVASPNIAHRFLLILLIL